MDLTKAQFYSLINTHRGDKPLWLVGIDLSSEITDLINDLETRADLRKIDLSGAILDGANLSNARLNNAILTNAKFIRAKLTGAILTDAFLIGADFTGANLTGANLTGAHFTGADFTGADLDTVQFANTKVDRAIFTNAINLVPAQFQGVISKAGIQGLPENFFSR